MTGGTAANGAWMNWAGNVRATPRLLIAPRSLAEVRAAVIAAGRRGDNVRVAGAGHSFAPLCATTGTLLDLSRLAGLERIDSETGDATIWAGSRIADLGEPLLARGRAFANQGDIDTQAIAGAVSTGTHGTGRKHGSFSAAVRAVELMSPDGDLVTVDSTDPERLRAASLSLGLLGVITRLTFATVPAYKLRESTQVLPFEVCLDRFLAVETSRRHAEFWWLPAHDSCVLKTLVETDEAPYRTDAPEALPGTLERYLKPDAVDWSWRIYPSTRSFPFVEMEYTLPLAAGPAAMREIRKMMQTRYADCTWAVEYRTQSGEQHHLSPTRGNEGVTISLHQAANLPFEPLFRDAEGVFRAHDGRPHWGKLHFLGSDQIARLYPELPAFRSLRAGFDPKGMFTNDYLASLGLAGDPSGGER